MTRLCDISKAREQVAHHAPHSGSNQQLPLLHQPSQGARIGPSRYVEEQILHLVEAYESTVNTTTASIGHKIPSIENLGVAGQHDTIDLTDNELTVLGNFPLSIRLNTLLCARNRIHHVDRRISEAVPNLTTLMLANNNIKELTDLEGLTRCLRLTHLVLQDNPVARNEVSFES